REENVYNLLRSQFVEHQRDVSELSLTGHIISRTRKIDAMPNRPPRRPQSVSVQLQAVERRFYERVGELYCLANPHLGDWGLAMAVLTVFRYTASCIPAAVELVRERLAAGVEAIAREDSGAIDGATDDAREDSPDIRGEIADDARTRVLRELRTIV